MKKKVLIILIVMLVSVYRINNNMTKTISYNGNNLMISVDGEVTETLPTSGTYYLVDYDCKSSNTKISWDKNNYKLNISNGNKKGGVICNLEFKSKPLLSEMEMGSYVSYTGNNGCDADHCNGNNSNYVSNTNMGYCVSSSYPFKVNGWRIGYIENGSAHLISAGAPECMCTNSNGDSSGNCNSDLSSSYLFKHYENMNNVALKYCNIDFAKGGVCVTNSVDSNVDNTVWAMHPVDFKKITGSNLSPKSCYESALTPEKDVKNRVACGYVNDLINIGSHYWFADSPAVNAQGSYCWLASNQSIVAWNSGNRIGIRPILALESSVFVTSGEGTYENPYKISNYSFRIDDDDAYITDSVEKSNIQLILSGSDVNRMCISVNTSICTNYIDYNHNYILDLSGESNGKKFIYVYYQDAAGNIVATMNKSIVIDIAS